MKMSCKTAGVFLMLAVLLCPVAEVRGQEGYVTVSGTIRDKMTRRPIEYATISVVDRNVGTVSNADGAFVLKIPNTAGAASMECTHIGYQSYRTVVQPDDDGTYQVDILMEPYVNELNAVVISGWDAYYLVQDAVSRIGQNYSAAPNMLTGFYRETIQKRRNYINITEAVTDVYKTAYTEGVLHDRVQILKGRKLISPRASDTLAVKLLGGPTLAIFMDVTKNHDVLFDKETLTFFSYRMEGMTQMDGRDQYVVHFEPRVVKDYPLFVGTFYIDKESLTFTRAEFHIDMSEPGKVTDMVLRKKPAGLRFRPEEISYVVSYKERGGVNCLSYIRNEIRFRCDWRRRLFSTRYAVISEMVVTDLTSENVAVISRKDAFKQNQILSDNVEDFYDDDFWGAYNIIEPTESLESAVNRLRKQHTVD